MFGSAVIDTTIGVVVVFAVTALLCSGVTEAISNVLQLRGRYLFGGLRRLLEDPAATAKVGASGKAAINELEGLAAARAKPVPATAPPSAKQQFQTAYVEVSPATTQDLTRDPNESSASVGITRVLLEHPNVQASISPGTRLSRGSLRIPQYLSSQAFRTALLDTLLPDTLDPNEPNSNVLPALSKTVKNLPDQWPVKQALQSFLKQSEGKISNVETAIEKWYDDQMDRVSGWYKRFSQLILAATGLVVALALNIDALQVGHALWQDEPLRSAVAATATSGTICQDKTTPADKAACTTQELESLKASGIPIGWRAGCAPLSNHWAPCLTREPGDQVSFPGVLLKILGWLLVAAAVSFGAPFWFDALGKLGSLRSAGAKPAASQGTSSA